MDTSQKIQAGLGFAFGVIFVSVILTIAVFIPLPSDFQYQVFRIVLALAAGGVGAVIPGSLNVNIPKVLTAGGALAVFVVVYFYSPAQLAVKRIPSETPAQKETSEAEAKLAKEQVEHQAAIRKQIEELEPQIEDSDRYLQQWQLNLIKAKDDLATAEQQNNKISAGDFRKAIEVAKATIEHFDTQKKEQMARRDALEKQLR
jgi:hypothetical protein